MRAPNAIATCGFAVLLSSCALGQAISEFPPYLQPTIDRSSLCGGRTQSIAVRPGMNNEIVIATEVGGLWKSMDGGSNWRHLSNLVAIWAKDVAFADGDTLVATVQGTNKIVDDSGVWVSHDGGSTWSPAALGWNGAAYAVSVAPDNRRKIYVATEFGVALSGDNGATWSHTAVDGGPRSILALERNKAIVLTGSGVYRLTPDGTWDNVQPGNFHFNDPSAFKLVDAVPGNLDKIFILQDYNNLFLYEMGANRFSRILVPAGGHSRHPFVRVSMRAGGAPGFDIWMGGGVHLMRRTCGNLAEALATGPLNWASFGRDDGVHDDSGYMGLNSANLPVLYGSDGGIFKPSDPSATHWERAAVTGSGLNSYQITALGGTEYAVGNTSLYFATQDNGSLWSSPDAGFTWPRASAPEGSFVQVAPFAHDPANVTVAWNSVVQTPRWGYMFANGNMDAQREVPTNSRGSRTGYLTDFSMPFYVNPRTWVRFRYPDGGVPELFVSRDNGDNWVHNADIFFARRGFPEASGVGARETVYAPFTANPNGAERIGLIKFDLHTDRNYGPSDMIYLPENGSLGLRATMFDQSAVFGVDPTNPDFIIAPDIVNNLVMVTHTGGATWDPDLVLTDLVTKNRRLKLFQGAWNMEITSIYFDPFNSQRILIGTREAGIIWSGDGGATWDTIPGSERILYCTGFFMTHTNEGFASSYGRGLWKLDFRHIRAPFPHSAYCRLHPCYLRYHGDPAVTESTLAYDVRNVMVVHNGHINGLKLGKDGKIDEITVTLGSNYVQYLGKAGELTPLRVKESEKGDGFDDEIAAQAAARNNEFINAIVMQGGKIEAIMSSKAEFVRTGMAQGVSTSPNVKQAEIVDQVQGAIQKIGDLIKGHKAPSPLNFAYPCLFVNTSLVTTGLPVVGSDGILRLWAAGVKPKSDIIGMPIVVTIDGVVVIKDVRFGKDGTMSAKIKLPDDLAYGSHVVALTFGAKPFLQSAFVKCFFDEAKEQPNEGK